MRSAWRLRYFAAVMAAVLVGDLAALAASKTGQHPLAGAILSAGDGAGKSAFAPILREELVKRLKAADVVLLGEVHDNAEHHRFRAQLLGDLKRATVFEHIAVDRQPAVDRALAQQANGAAPGRDAFFAAIDWDKSGWSKYPNAALFETALKLRLPIYAGDVTRALILNAAKEKDAALPEIERARLKLDAPLDAKSNEESLDEIAVAHCGAMPKEALSGMAYAQRYRDAHLADVALKAAERHGSAVLLAGNGHVRTDRGAPWYIRQRSPETKIATVMFLEAEDGKTGAADYAPLAPNGAPATDYVVFTGAPSRPDPCEAFRKANGN